MLISIIDLGINNIRSIERAISQVKNREDELHVVTSPNSKLYNSKLIILPGVGHFNRGTDALDFLSLRKPLVEITETGAKIVGVCLGMQLLFQSSDEAVGKAGLGLIPGHCQRIDINRATTVPHMGWNTVNARQNISEFNELSKGKDFYFVHSYHAIPENKENILAETPLRVGEFTSAVKKNNIIGFQFHPEKSGVAGRTLLGQTLKWARDEN